MRLAHTLRLIVALIALGFAMAGSVAAASAMEPSMLACHEQVHEQVHGGMSDAGSAPAHLIHACSAGGHTTVDMGHPMGADAARLHMCCVLSQLMAPPLTAPGLSHPAPRTSALLIPLARRLAGVSLATPVPPPRLL